MEENQTKKDVWEVIDTLSFSTHIGENAGRSDHMFFQHLQEGKKNGDLDKIYEFIEACERGMGRNTDSNVVRLFRKAFEEDPDRLCRVLAEKNSLMDYWMYVSSNCETDMIVAFTKMDVAYPCFYYECARVLLEKMQEDVQCEEGVIAATKKLASVDLKLWKRWLIKNESDSHWQKLAFGVLSQVDPAALEIYAQNIHLDMNPYTGIRDVLAQKFEDLPEESRKYILSHIAGKIIIRWNELIEKRKKAFQTADRPLFTAYFILVLYSIQEMVTDKEKWKDAFIKSAKMMEEDMYQWYARQINMQSVFFYDITQIYYLLIVGQECGHIEKSEELSEYIRRTLQIMGQYEYFWRECEEQKGDIEERLKFLLYFTNSSK